MLVMLVSGFHVSHDALAASPSSNSPGNFAAIDGTLNPGLSKSKAIVGTTANLRVEVGDSNTYDLYNPSGTKLASQTAANNNLTFKGVDFSVLGTYTLKRTSDGSVKTTFDLVSYGGDVFNVGTSQIIEFTADQFHALCGTLVCEPPNYLAALTYQHNPPVCSKDSSASTGDQNYHFHTFPPSLHAKVMTEFRVNYTVNPAVGVVTDIELQDTGGVQPGPPPIVSVPIWGIQPVTNQDAGYAVGFVIIEVPYPTVDNSGFTTGQGVLRTTAVPPPGPCFQLSGQNFIYITNY